MWHPSWGGYTTSGDLPGPPVGAFNGGGYIAHRSTVVPNLPPSVPPGQWNHPGQAMWQTPSSTTCMGTFSGSHTSMTTGPPTFQGCSPVTFPPTAPLGTTNLQAPGPEHPSWTTSSSSRTSTSSSLSTAYILNRKRFQSFGRPPGCSIH